MRSDYKAISLEVHIALFDFDGTLTASPGEAAVRCRKHVELAERAPLLAPRLRAMKASGMTLGIISKSTHATITNALSEAGLDHFFDGPILAKAVGFEGKAGIIDDLYSSGSLGDLGSEGLRRILLIDDDVRELERARIRGIQTFAAPAEGGLQDGDFDLMFAELNLHDPEKMAAMPPLPL